MTFKFEIGSQVKDKISGFTGVVSARAEYYGDHRTYQVSPLVDKEQKYKEPEWFHEPRLEAATE